MSFLNFFSKPNINEGVEQYKSTPNAVLLDVRSSSEYAQGHIPGSKNIPLDRIQTISVPKSAPLFVYCLSGGRSEQATAWLKQNGYNATNIGGISSYTGKLG